MDDKQYFSDLCDELSDKIKELKIKKLEVTPTDQEIKEALDLHLQQLQKNGATLEDSVCQVLRKFLEVAEISKDIEEKEVRFKKYLDEYENFIMD